MTTLGFFIILTLELQQEGELIYCLCGMCLCGVWWSKDREARANGPRVSCTWYGKQWLEVEEIWKRSLSCALFVPPPPPGLPNESSGMLVGKLLLSSCWRTVWVLCFRLYLTVGETILQRERRACLSLSYGSPLSRVFCIKKEKRRRQQQGKGGFSYCCPIPLPRTDDIQEIFSLSLFCRFHSGIFWTVLTVRCLEISRLDLNVLVS